MILCRPCHDHLHKNFPNKAYVYQENEIPDLKWWIRTNHDPITGGRKIKHEPSKRITYPNFQEKKGKKKKNRRGVHVRKVLDAMTEVQKDRIIAESGLSGVIELRTKLYNSDKIVRKVAQRVCGCRISGHTSTGRQSNLQKPKIDWNRQKWGIR
jgi:hypothetical protein